MSEENVNDIVEEVVDNSPEVSENESENTDELPKEEPYKEPYKAWAEENDDENFRKDSETVPRTRLNEVIYERNDLRKRIPELEEELKKFRETSEKVSKYNSVDDLKLSNFDTIEDYQRALVEVIQKNTEKVYEQREEAKRIQKIENDIEETFNNRLIKASKNNPDVIIAYNYISKKSNLFSPETRYALVTDEHAPEIIHEIATTEGLLKSLLQMNPIDAGRKIGRMSAKYDDRPEGVSRVTAKGSEIPDVMPKTPAKTGSPNTQGKPANVGKVKWHPGMSASEQKQLQKEGRLTGW